MPVRLAAYAVLPLLVVLLTPRPVAAALGAQTPAPAAPAPAGPAPASKAPPTSLAQTPAPPTAPNPGPGEQRWFNPGRSFHLLLPAGWRTLAPNEARKIGEDPRAPAPLAFAQPNLCYAVGPVDAWLAGDYSGPWLYVAERDGEWHIEDDYAKVLTDSWRERSEASGERNELRDIQLGRVSIHGVEAVLAVRRNTPPPPRPAVESLDASCPAGPQQITLSFKCAPEQMPRWEGEFRRRLHSLDFARLPRQKRTLGDRLWPPILAGGAISLILLLLYKHSRRRR